MISGRLVREAELKTLNSGKSVLNFSIACTRGFGEHEKTSFFDVQMFGGGAEAVASYMIKGKHVIIDGEIEQDTWEKDGQKRSKVYIKTFSVELGADPRGGSEGTRTARAEPAKYKDDPDDDIPF